MGNWFCRTKKMRVLMLGLDGAGKTTMLYTMKLGEVVATIPTIGFNVETLEIDGVDLTCWDVGCRDKGRPLWRHYFSGTDGFIYMIDSRDTERLNEAIHELAGIILLDDKTRETVVMLVANKQDLDGALSAQEIEDVLMKTFRLSERSEHTVFVMGCSALDGDQISKVFSYFAYQLCLNEQGRCRRGLISCKEQDIQMNGNSDSKLIFKTTLKHSLEYIKTFFVAKA